MRKKCQASTVKCQSIILCFTAMFIFISAIRCYAAAWTSNELIEKAKELDNKYVIYRGELVTAIIHRQEYAWLNLDDGTNAIGIWCDKKLLNDVRIAGDYKQKGDTLEVAGIFHRACPEHNGELDIHAGTVKILKHGSLIKECVNRSTIRSSIILFSIAFITILIFRKKL